MNRRDWRRETSTHHVVHDGERGHEVRRGEDEPGGQRDGLDATHFYCAFPFSSFQMVSNALSNGNLARVLSGPNFVTCARP